MLCRLVGHHSCASIEASERGLAEVLALEFEPAPQELSDALTYCDMTTSPDGEIVPAEQRLAEIHDRYGPGHLVSRSIQRATPMILRAVEQVHPKSRPDHIAPRTGGGLMLRVALCGLRCVVAGIESNWLPEWLPGGVR